MYLAEQALEMLKGTRYWFSQLTLIQALCLLNLSDEPETLRPTSTAPSPKRSSSTGSTSPAASGRTAASELGARRTRIRSSARQPSSPSWR